MAASLAELIEQRFGTPSGEGRDAPAEGALATLLAHRTHRRFKPDPVPESLLRTLLACAFSTPSKSDLQQASVVLVKDAGKRAAIAALIPSMPWIGTAPEFMAFCGDGRRIRRICAMRGKPFANDHLEGFMNCAADAAMTLQSFVVAANAAGLGCCPISVVRNHAQEVSAILELPDGVFPFAGLCLGWPAREGWVSLRLPLAATVHVDRYDDSKLADEIDAYDRRRNARHAIPESEQKLKEKYGAAPFYGWSEDKARQVSEPERAEFGAFLRRRGFSLT
jgi:nitroreductase/FMN reductase [NAD(P)H]